MVTTAMGLAISEPMSLLNTMVDTYRAWERCRNGAVGMEGRERETGDKGRREKGESGSMGRITGLEEIGYVPPKVRQMYGAVVQQERKLLSEVRLCLQLLPQPAEHPPYLADHGTGHDLPQRTASGWTPSR